MEFFDLTSNDDNVTLSTSFVSPAQANPYSPGDSVRALDGNDTVNGSEANDDINGNIGDDLIDGLGGDDFIRGGQGDDIVQGSGGNDEVNGNIGNDTVGGGDGDDIVRGGQGDDSLNGGSGDDSLFGDLGIDTLTGGSGIDIFVLQVGKGTDTIADFRPGEDTFATETEIDLNNLQAIPSGNDTLITDIISGQPIAVVQGVDSKTVASELGIGTSSNLPRRLKVIARPGNSASSGKPTLIPGDSWERLTVFDEGFGTIWLGNGSLDITDASVVFGSYQPGITALPEVITLTIDPSTLGFGNVGFSAASYGYQLLNSTDPVFNISIPLVPSSSISTTTITFSNNLVDLGSIPLLN
jgi:RTX calcium-binding nonapeptide repeat (4 copies)